MSLVFQLIGVIAFGSRFQFPVNLLLGIFHICGTGFNDLKHPQNIFKIGRAHV